MPRSPRFPPVSLMSRAMSASLSPLVRTIVLVAPVFGVAACGGGGGGGGGGSNEPPPQQFTLSTKADAAREIANALGLLTDFDPRTTTDVATLAPGENAPFSGAKSASVMRAKAAVACQGGGTQDSTDVSTDPNAQPPIPQHTFAYFPSITIDVTGARNTFSACKVPHNTTTQTFDAVVEDAVGDTDSADEYRYTLAGTGGGYYRIDFVEGSGQDQIVETFQLRGLLELGVFNAERELIARNVSYLHSRTSGGKTVDLTVNLGQGASSANTTDQFSAQLTDDGNLSLDGLVEYHSSTCAGGTLKLQTQAPLIGDQGDPVSDTIVGGTLKVTAAAASAIVTFTNTGGASIDFGNGHIETLTAQEVSDARAANVCRNPS